MPRELTPEEIKAKFGKGKTSPAGTAVVKIEAIPEPMGPIMRAASAPVVVGRPPEMETEGTEGLREGGKPAADMMGRVVVEEFRRLQRAQLVVRVDNPRAKINVEKPQFKELVESVREMGVVTPLIVRPHPSLPDMYEILAGHRRHAAADVVELPDVPAMVKHLSDREALEVMCLENFDREDLTPLEEARSYRLMLDDDHRIEQLSVRIGKSRAHIARRVQLLKLNAKWLAFAEEYEIPAQHLELVARMDEAAQRRLWECFRLEAGKREGEWEKRRRLNSIRESFFGPGSFAKFKHEVADEMCDLALAPWDLEDTVLAPKAGACAVCPKRSGCQPDLFSEEEFQGGNRCLDTACWRDKMDAFKKRREAELKKDYPKLVRVKGENPPHLGYDQEKKLGLLESWSFKKCGSKTDGATPALIYCGDGEGTLIWIKREERGSSGSGKKEKKKESAAAKQAKASLDPKESARLLKEKQEAHEKRRWAWVCKRLQELVDEQELPVETGMNSPHGLCVLASCFGMEWDMPYPFTDGSRWRELEKYGSAAGKEVLQKMWKAIKPRIKQTLEVFTVGEIGKGHQAAIKGACWLLCLKVESLKAKADAEIPEPKSWEQLRKLSEAPAGGGRKTKAKGQNEKPGKAKPDKTTPAKKKPASADATWTPEEQKTNKAAGKKKGGKAA